MKEHKEKSLQKQHFGMLQSLRTRVVLLVLISIVTTIVALLALVIPIADKSLSKLTENYMYDVCGTTGTNIDAAINRSGNAVLTTDYLTKLIGDVSINGVDSSYAYVVAANGNIIYHPDADKIGQPIENTVVSGLIDEIKSGNVPEPAVVTYEFNGIEKYASYYVTCNASAILVVTADKTDILGSTVTILRSSILCGIAIFIIFGIISYIIASKMTKPLLEITTVINRFSSLNLAESPTTQRLSKRSDETGQIARAIASLREELVKIVTDIKEQSSLLYHASAELDANASQTTATVGSVEIAVNEIATGATSQASETQKATDDIINMGNMIEHTNSEVENLHSTADSMKKSSDEASATLSELNEINQRAIASIDIIYDQTNTTNASALKIKEATSLISSIAEETNLLSLNASIEAARAGEAGRGFAVVASQIQKLAEQSNDSARQIDDIIHILIDDSQKAVETMDEVKEIMNQQSLNVNKTDVVFAQVRDGIGHSITGVGEIANKTSQLDSTRSSVVDVVQSLTAIAQQNAASTEETSASVIEVSNIMEEITANAEQLKKIATVLDESVNEFKL